MTDGPLPHSPDDGPGTGVAVVTVPVRVGHRHDEEAKALFERVGQEEGHLDIRVNNAALIREELPSTSGRSASPPCRSGWAPC